MKACTADAGARIGTDWISELMDSDLDVNDLQLDDGLLADDEQLGELLTSSSLAGVAAGHGCGRNCGCGFALQPHPQHAACEPLPALAELLRCGQHGGDCGADDAEQWLPELPDGMDLPASGADPLEAMLAELSGPDERFGEVDAGAPPAGSAATSPARRRAGEPVAWGSPSVTTASDQTHASPGLQPGHASADGGTESSSAAACGPAHSSDGVHSAAVKAMPMAAASAREPSPGCETSQRAPQRSSSGSASPAASDSEGSGPVSRQHAAPASAGTSSAEGSPRSDAFHRNTGPAAAAAPCPQPPAQPPAPQQWPLFQAGLQQPAWQQQQPAQQQPTSSGNTPSAYTLGSPPQEEAQRAALKVARNRESAQQSRQRKRAAGDEVQRRCDELQRHNGQLAGVVQRLTAENAVLRHQLLAVCAATGATPPMPVSPPAFAAGPAAGHPPQAAPLGAAPKIPIQKLKPQRPMPAPQRPTVGATRGLPVSSPPEAQQHTRKKLKSAAGATTALLAVFACVMLLSPMGPPAGGGGALQGAQVVPYAPAGRPYMAGHGRVLNALPPAQLPGNATTHAQAVEVVRGMLNDLSELSAAGGGGDAGSFNGSEALAMRYNDPVLETLALQRLKELAPLALFSAGDGQLLPGGRTFGGVAGEALGAEGLAAPVACREVFRFDAARVLRPDFPAARMEAYIDSLTTPKRRRTQALPLLPVGTSSAADGGSRGDHSRDDAAGTTPPRAVGGSLSSGHVGRLQRKQRRPTIGGDDDSKGGGAGADDSRRLGGSTLVSMLLPTRNASAQQSGNLTALDQIYIVMMEPSDMYATYSCRLPSPVLL